MVDDPIPPAPGEDDISRRLQDALRRARDASLPGGFDDPHDREAARLERLEAEIDSGAGVALPSLEDSSPEGSSGEESSLDVRLREVEAKVHSATMRREAAAVQADRIRKMDQDSARGTGLGLSAAYALMGLPLAGAAIGFTLNKATGGNAWLPIFAILGMVGGIWWVVRLTNHHDRK